MGPQSNLKIQKEWCRYWIRSHYGFEQRSALVLLLSEERPRHVDFCPTTENPSKLVATRTTQASDAFEKTLHELRWQFAQPVFVLLKINSKSNRYQPDAGPANAAIDDFPTRWLSALDHSESVSSASDLCAWICASDTLLMVETPQKTKPMSCFGWIKPIAEVAYGFGKPLNTLDLDEEALGPLESTVGLIRNPCSNPKIGELNWERLHQSNRETLAIAAEELDFTSPINPGSWTYEQGLQRLEKAWSLASEISSRTSEDSSEQRKVA